MLIFFGIIISALGVLILVQPRIMWPFVEFQNLVRGIKGSKPTAMFDLITRVQVGFVIFMGIMLIVMGYPDLQKEFKEMRKNAMLSTITIYNLDGVLKIKNNLEQEIELTLANCICKDSLFGNSHVDPVNLNEVISAKESISYELQDKNDWFGQCFTSGPNNDVEEVDCTAMVSSILCGSVTIKKEKEENTLHNVEVKCLGVR